MSARVIVAGVAPGCEVLDAKTEALLKGADLLVVAKRHMVLAKNFTGEVVGVERRVGETVNRVAADPTLKAVFLASGDPGFFGIATLLSRKLPAGELEVIPAVSSMQAAFAMLGVSWSDARFASLHGRPFAGLAKVLGAPKIGLLTDEKNTPAKVSRFLVDAGWGNLEMAVVSDIGMAGESVERGPVGDFAAWTGSAMNVVVLIDGAADTRPLGPGLPEELFAHPRGRITKREVRAAALGLLSLPREGVMWDVGAGSGSVGIEAALLAPALTVYAVERDAEAFGHVVENRKRLKVANLVPVDGGAPEALELLADPDRVFIGGSGGMLAQVLDLVAGRLKAGGKVVITTVLQETFDEALKWAASTSDWRASWSEIVSSRSKQVGTGTMKISQNPVSIICIERDAGDAADG
jgi:precorrin-6Y C5,15-methyltransferase (decarboxylating)